MCLAREQTDFLLTRAFNAAVSAGAKIYEIYTSYDDFGVSLKADSTPITIADRQAHSIIAKRLAQTRIPILSEEGRDILYEERQNWDLFWLVDPLDGTRQFIERTGEFTINIALIADNKPLLGVIYHPCSDTVYLSDPDRGAFSKVGVRVSQTTEYTVNEIFRDARKLPLHSEQGGRSARLLLSRVRESNVAHDFIENVRTDHPDLQVLEYGSSLKLCLLAEGSADYYIRTTQTMEWDTAAGEAIMRGAGVRICDLHGNDLQYNKEKLENPPFLCKCSR